MVVEKQLLWHPTSSQSHFALADFPNGQIVVYDWYTSRRKFRPSSSINDLASMKCVDWSADITRPHLFAVGMPSGRINLVSPELDGAKVGGLQLSPRTARSCTSLAFNREATNLLAAGFEKSRGENSLLIYDLEKLSPIFNVRAELSEEETLSRPLKGGYYLPNLLPTSIDPLSQFATGDSISSVKFITRSRDLVIAAVSQKWLRSYDIRSSASMNSALRSVSSSLIEGLVTDPLDSNRFASFGGGTIHVWDLRRLQQPLLSFNNYDAIGDTLSPPRRSIRFSIEFSSSTRGLLACLEENSDRIRFWDIYEVPPSHERFDSTFEAIATPTATQTKTSWKAPHTLLSNLRSDGFHDKSHNSVPYILADTISTEGQANSIFCLTFVPREQTRTSLPTVLVATRSGQIDMISKPNCMVSASYGAQSWLCTPDGSDLHLVRARHDRLEPEGNSNPVKPKNDLGLGSASVASAATSLSSPMIMHARSLEHESSKDKLIQYAIEKDRNTFRGEAHLPAELRAAFRISLDDISERMRMRAIQGYSSRNFLTNSHICRRSQIGGKTLFTIWQWLYHCENVTGHSSHILGYDFRFQGAQTLWEGLPLQTPPQAQFLHSPASSPRNSLPGSLDSTGTTLSSVRSLSSRLPGAVPLIDPLHGSYTAALNALVPPRSFNWETRIKASTNKLQHRVAILQLCGFLSGENDLDAIKRWEKEGKRRKAACWALFCNHVKYAIQILTNSTDDADKLAGGILVLLLGGNVHDGQLLRRSPQVREHYTRLIPKLGDHYLRATLYYAALEDWSEVLAEDLPLPEKLTIAFRYLSDDEVTNYLPRILDSCRKTGDLLGLMLTGLAPEGMSLLQSFVDLTGDVQSAALISSLVCPGKYSHPAASRWAESYKGLLTGWGLNHGRVSFDIMHPQHQTISQQEPVGSTLIMLCHYCGKPLQPSQPVNNQTNARSVCCMNCGRALPRCSVCLLPVEVFPNHRARKFLMHTPASNTVFCQTCRHGGHVPHLFDWFCGSVDGLTRRQVTCPVADCNCRCAEEFPLNARQIKA